MTQKQNGFNFQMEEKACNHLGHFHYVSIHLQTEIKNFNKGFTVQKSNQVIDKKPQRKHVEIKITQQEL